MTGLVVRALSLMLAYGRLAGALAAQKPSDLQARPRSADTVQPAAQSASATITPADIMQDWHTLGADSMRGTAPGPAIDRVAHYLGRRLSSLGLSVELQRYPVPRQFQMDYATAVITFVTKLHGQNSAATTEAGAVVRHETKVPFATAARFLGAVVPNDMRALWWLRKGHRSSVLLAGPHTLASSRAVDLQGKTVLYVPPVSADTASRNAIARDLAARSDGVVVASASDATVFAARLNAASAHPPYMAADYLPEALDSWVVEVWPRALREVLTLNGTNLVRLQSASTPVVQQLPFLTIGLDSKAASLADTITAPNVVATLQGSDPQLQGEALTIVVPMDRRGSELPDATAGMAGLLALAKAFSQPGAQPRRSLVFVATSGGEGRWGSYSFLPNKLVIPGGKPRPKFLVMLSLGSRLTSDLVMVAGLQEVDAQPSLAWVAALHPELAATVVDTGSVLAPGTESSIFASSWLPTLAFHAGRSAPSPGGGSPTAQDATMVAHLVQLMSYAIRAWADADELPTWNPATRQQILQSAP